MKKLAVLALILTLGVGSIASAATINARVITDKSTYGLGDTVNWTIYAWSSVTSDNHGISLVSVDLNCKIGAVGAETLAPAAISGSDLAGSLYVFTNGFSIIDNGTTSGLGTLLGVDAAQNNKFPHYNIGNDGLNTDELAQGSFVAGTLGTHVMSLSLVAANYWPDQVAGNNPVAFGASDVSGTATFNVTQALPEPCTMMLLGLGGVALLRRRK